jgi:Protein of unknown function (DUF1524)
VPHSGVVPTIPLRLAAVTATVTATVAAAVAAALSAVLTGCGPLTEPGTAGGGSIDPSAASQQLGQLQVAASRSMTGYSRERFPHWTQHEGGCSTRELVLKRDGTGVTTGANCTVTGGHWVSPYDEKATADPQSLDIDHMVPLANAWRSGADAWTDEQRSKFANDLDHPQLFAVTASVNRAKGDQDPSLWKPPNHAFWCRYAQDWILVKFAWKLTVTQKEKAALTDMLGTC